MGGKCRIRNAAAIVRNVFMGRGRERDRGSGTIREGRREKSFPLCEEMFHI